jgi:predicted nucleic acid-binding protein
MLVVPDTSPINYLVLLEQTAVLPALYTRVLLPPTVVRELRDAEASEPVRAWTADLPTRCEIRHPAAQVETEALAHLGAGEREAIVLAQEIRAGLLLIDEADGRRGARSRGLIELPSTLARLLTTTFRVQDELLQAMLARDAARKRPR